MVNNELVGLVSVLGSLYFSTASIFNAACLLLDLLWFRVMVMFGLLFRALCFLVPPPTTVPLFVISLPCALVAVAAALLAMVDIDLLRLGREPVSHRSQKFGESFRIHSPLVAADIAMHVASAKSNCLLQVAYVA
jgi:hypothetical protein